MCANYWLLRDICVLIIDLLRDICVLIIALFKPTWSIDIDRARYSHPKPQNEQDVGTFSSWDKQAIRPTGYCVMCAKPLLICMRLTSPCQHLRYSRINFICGTFTHLTVVWFCFWFCPPALHRDNFVLLQHYLRRLAILDWLLTRYY